jgi:hypothetical protein
MDVRTVRRKALKYQGADGADATDANFALGSEPEEAGSGIPFMITRTMRRRLHELGYTDGAVRVMRPADAWRLLECATDSEEPMDDLMPGTEAEL